MKITNLFNLPAAIYNAIVNDDYDGPKWDSDKVSVTTLIAPPRIYFLKKRHWAELTEDASSRLWSLLGRAVHAILQAAGSRNNIVEERLEKKVGGMTISGKMDIMDEYLIEDYKITSVWQYVHSPVGGKPEHAAQLNLLRWLTYEIFPNISDLRINMILRDWSAGKAKSTPDFPRIPFVSIRVPVWSIEQVNKFVADRVALFLAAADKSDDDLPECSPEECWERPTVYAIVKDGGKRAIPGGLCASMAEAEGKMGPKMHVEVREGGRMRCAEYCAVNGVCSQYKAYLAAHGGAVAEAEVVE